MWKRDLGDFLKHLPKNTSNDTINIGKIIIVAFWVWRQKSKQTKNPKKHTFQVINGLLKLGYWSLSELSTSLSLHYRDRFRSQSNTWCGNLCKLSWCESKTPDGALWNCTSFSLSVRTLISSSYLSSFCEYCGSKATTAIRNRKHVRWDKYFHCIYRNELKKKKQKWRGSSAPHPSSLQGSCKGLTACSRPEGWHVPSQPVPPVTSGCWSQFSTLPQAQSICWCFRG